MSFFWSDRSRFRHAARWFLGATGLGCSHSAWTQAAPLRPLPSSCDTLTRSQGRLRHRACYSRTKRRLLTRIVMGHQVSHSWLVSSASDSFSQVIFDLPMLSNLACQFLRLPFLELAPRACFDAREKQIIGMALMLRQLLRGASRS